jgi:hypothetical protein
MKSHNYNFDGGEILAKIGASWFVSYAYFERINRAHMNWSHVSTAGVRMSKYRSGRIYHKKWLQEVLIMAPVNLEKNTLGLSADRIKEMAQEILDGWKDQS